MPDRRNQPIRLLAACLLLSAAALRVAHAAEPEPAWNLELVGQMGGQCLSVDVVGGHAYVGEGQNLTILDVSNAPSPIPVRHLSLGDFFPLAIQVRGDIAYVAGTSFASHAGLRIIDISNPSSPRALAFYPAGESTRNVFVDDGLAYLAVGGGLVIFDVIDPTSPTLRGSIHTGASYAFGIYMDLGKAYLGANDGLHIVDVTDPSLPSPLGFYSQDDCHDVFVADGLAYTGTEHGLEIVDVTSPTAPARRGRLSPGPATGLVMSTGLVFLAQQQIPNGLRIVDVTDPSSPSQVGFCATSGWAADVAISSSTAYLADWGGGLSIIDVSTSSSPTLHSFYETLSDAMDVWVEDGVAYVANGVRGLKTIDVTNPRSPKILGSLPTPDPAYKITVSDKRAYLAFTLGSVYIVDVTTPTSPVMLGSYTVPEAYDLAVSGGYAYIASINELQIVDVTDPTSPTLRGSFATPGWESGICVSGDLAFVADYNSLQIIDVSDPTAPVFRSSYPGARVSDVFVSDGVAYISGGTPDFACIDVTAPDSPRLLGTYALSGWIYETEGLHVSNGLAYVFMDGIRVLDVSDPTRPTLVGHYPTARSSFFWGDIFASGNLVYSADEYGLRVFQFTSNSAARRAWGSYK